MADEVKAKEGAGGEQQQQDKMLSQAQVDAIVQDRLARERAKFADYDDLRKFKSEYEKQLDAKTQKELEDRKEYEKAKEGWQKREQEFTGIISKKDTEITDMKISSALMNEVIKQNAYPEETMALLKQQATFDKEGNIRIKGRDANGLEVMHSVEEGLKQFLTQRPHLVKVAQKTGGGTGAGSTAGAGVGGEDLATLNEQFLEAQTRGDRKRMSELKTKIAATMAHSRPAFVGR